MCPMCMTSAAIIAAGSASGAGVLGYMMLKFRALRGAGRGRSSSNQSPTRSES
jgi:hypothetical protein